MLASLLKLKAILSQADVVRLWGLLGLILLTAALELVGIASVLPFFKLAANPNAIQENAWLKWLYDSLGFSNPNQMLVASGWSVIGFLAIANLLNILSSWKRQVVTWSIAHSVSMKLINSYAEMAYEYFLRHNSAELIRKIIGDVNSLVVGVLESGCQFFSTLVMSGVILGLLVSVEPGATLAVLGLLSCAYLGVLIARRTYLTRLGKERLEVDYARYQTFSELIHGIKVVKTDGAEEFFTTRFEEYSLRFSKIHPKFHFTSTAPKYVIEALAFSILIGVMLFMLGQGRSLLDVLPTLTLFAVAGYRLMPALSSAYSSLTKVISSLPAIDSIHEDICASNELPIDECSDPLVFSERIQLNNVTFGYSKRHAPVLENVSVEVPCGGHIAIVGPTGSGKTTLVNVFMGLLKPVSGKLMVDGQEVSHHKVRGWQQLVGYVPQDVFLFDDTLARNITLGAERDEKMLRRACRLAQLEEVLETDLPEHLETMIGENGVRLSGGQRQRVGLARALYRQPKILVLDEATSALDHATEARFVDALRDEAGDLTIIMVAHRITSIQHCDRLYYLEQGQISAEGTFEELLESHAGFRQIKSLAEMRLQ